jgi:hypothetical protein
MPIDVQMPDGTIISGVPDNITQADLLARYNAFVPAVEPVGSARKPEDIGFVERNIGAAKRGVEQLSDTFGGLGLAGTALTGTEAETAAKMQKIKREQAIPQETPGYTAADIERIYKEKGLLSAAGSVPSYITEQVLQAAPSMAGPLAAGAAATAVSAPFGPAAPVVGALVGIGTYGVQQFGNFLTRQAIEKKDAKELDLLKAAGTAAATAPLGYFADRFTAGLGGLGTKKAGEEILKELSARQVAAKVGKRAAAGATAGIIAEAPLEVLEQAAERYQAGLSLTGDDAANEYKEAFFGAAAAGAGIGGTSRAIQAYQTPVRPEDQAAPPPAAVPPVGEVPPPEARPVPPSTSQDTQAMIDEFNRINNPPVDQAAPPVDQTVPPVDTTVAPAANIWESIQNRDRSTPASVAQMAKIANEPDYSRVSMSRDYGTGAPIVAGQEIDPVRLGRTDTVTGADGKKVPIQYGVIEASEVIPSHNADGTKNPSYVDQNVAAFRAITNGRVAGLQAAYNQGTAADYREALLSDDLHGISREVIEGMQNPMLVRVMPMDQVNKNTGDVSNTGAGLTFNVVEQAKNDTNRVDLSKVQFNDSGDVSPKTVQDFIKSMPDTERGNLIGKDGNPTKQAVDRLDAAIFQQAYGNDKLTEIAFQSQDEEARNIIRALNMAASKAIRLGEAGDYDVRPLVNEAVELAINARRNNISLADAAAQVDITANPLANDIIKMFANNPRSAKAIGENLSNLFDNAYAEGTKSGEDMFGAVPKRSVDELIKESFAKKTEPDLFEAEKATRPTENAEEPIQFKSKKSMEEIAKDIDSITEGSELAQYLVDTAPNAASKAIAERTLVNIKAIEDSGVPVKINILKGAKRKSYFGSSLPVSIGKKIKYFRVEYNGLNSKGQAETFPGSKDDLANIGMKVSRTPTGTRYSTLLHELLHVISQVQLDALIKRNYKGPDKVIYNELRSIYNAVKKQIELEKKTIPRANWHPLLTEVGSNNTGSILKDIHELFVRSLTEKNVQSYLSSVNMGKKTALTKLMEVFRKVLGLDPEYQSALDRIMIASERIFAQTPADMKRLAQTEGFDFPAMKEEVTPLKTDTPQFKKWFGNSKITNEDGSPKVVYHGTDRPDFDIFNPASYFSESPKESSRYANVGDLKKRERGLKRFTLIEDTSPAGKTVPYAGILEDHSDLKKNGIYATDNGVYKYIGNGNFEAYKNITFDYDTAKDLPNGDVSVKLSKGISQEAIDRVEQYKQYLNEYYPGGEGGRVYPVYLSIKNPVYLDAFEANRLGLRLGATPELIKETIDKYKAMGYDGIVTESDEARQYVDVRNALGGIPKQYIPFDSNQVKSAVGNTGEYSTTDARIQKEEITDEILQDGLERQDLYDKFSPELKRLLDKAITAENNAKGILIGRFEGKSEQALKSQAGRTENAYERAFDKEFPRSKISAASVKTFVTREGRFADFDKRVNAPDIKYEEVSQESDKEKPTATARNYLGKQIQANWAFPEDNVKHWPGLSDQSVDNFLYKIQDKQIDTKRAQQAIEKAAGEIEENLNVYEKEQLYHGRTATGIRKFLLDELMPTIKELGSLKLTPQDLKEYLYNRHAPERNDKMNEVNKLDPITGKERTTPWSLQDRASGISTKDAKEYMAKLDPAKKAALEKVAKRIDEMVQGTQQILLKSGAEDQATIDAYNNTYKNYVPLFRIEDDFTKAGGIGTSGSSKGFGVRGAFSKRAMGSEKEVQDILGNLIAQRERALIRAEKSKVGQALYGLALTNPNPDLWLPVNPDAIKNKQALIAELDSLGYKDAAEIANNLMEEPKSRYISKEKKQFVDPDTGLPMQVTEESVKLKLDNLKRFGDNVFPVRINGKDRYIFFNKNDPKALRMVHSLMNLDADSLGDIEGTIAKATRWFASVNTQYNPIFGVVNLIRDIGGSTLNLSTTAIAGDQAKVNKNVIPAMRGILNVLRDERKGKTDTSGKWAKAFQDFREQGGQTGYRDSLIRTDEEKQIIEREINKMKSGNTKKAFYAVVGALSDFNDMMENSIRVSAYVAALDRGLSKQKAAILAKNLTVNFDKKGQLSARINAYFAFFNASVQGTARLAKTLKGPKGKAIIGGGIALGAAQAVLLAMAGYDDDNPPEFIRERNFIVPLPDGKFLTIPYPLGFNVLPNVGRLTTEFVLSGGKDPGKKVTALLGSVVDAFSPVGGSELSLQTIAPTVLDPVVAIATNEDAFGRPIYKKDQATNPTPGYLRSRENASEINKNIAYFLNLASGGTKYSKGYVSPTGDELDYLVGQITGGVGRELLKTEQTVKAAVTGEELPAYRIPLAGRFYGETQSNAAESQRFYDNIIRMADHENEVKGRIKNKEPVGEYLRENPQARFWRTANNVENQINQLNKQKKEFIEQGLPRERIKRIENQKAAIMKRFNDQIAQSED